MTTAYKPTTRLRFIEREVKGNIAVSRNSDGSEMWSVKTERVLQQWFGPDMPSYMADPTVGEWCDVPLVEGAP